MEQYPVVIFWKMKKRWGSWRKLQTSVNNAIELKTAMEKIASFGEEAKFLGVNLK